MVWVAWSWTQNEDESWPLKLLSNWSLRLCASVARGCGWWSALEGDRRARQIVGQNSLSECPKALMTI